MPRESTYNHIPVIKKYYDKWTVIGKPIPFLNKNSVIKSGYQTRWKAPCECACGRRDLIDIQNLMNGRSGQCVVCGNKESGKRIATAAKRLAIRIEAFGERKTLEEWAKDPRCVCRTHRGLYTRLKRETEMSPEDIIVSTAPRKGRRRKLTSDQIREVYKRANAGERGIDLAIEFKISGSIISEIKTGKAYADATSKA